MRDLSSSRCHDAPKGGSPDPNRTGDVGCNKKGGKMCGWLAGKMRSLRLQKKAAMSLERLMSTAAPASVSDSILFDARSASERTRSSPVVPVRDTLEEDCPTSFAKLVGPKLPRPSRGKRWELAISNMHLKS